MYEKDSFYISLCVCLSALMFHEKSIICKLVLHTVYLIYVQLLTYECLWNLFKAVLIQVDED